MVCGQTRGEHEAFIQLNKPKTVDEFIRGKRGTNTDTPVIRSGDNETVL